jgi:glycosyltransferase involved in cell wall biosynthesis
VTRHIVFMNWRDTANPEGGGSEVYVEHIGRGLVSLGHRVTIVCAAHDRAPADEVRDGIRFVRRGTKATVYPRAWWLAFRRRLGHVDLFVDVQNGLPFFARLAGRTPVVVLVHHVHKEQWPVVYPGLAGRIGWFLESRAARRLFAGSQYVAVSRATRTELIRLGVRADHVAVVHNGSHPAPAVEATPSTTPMVASLGRLVPHKQIEHLVDAVEQLLPEFPDLHLSIVGSGWWEEELVHYVKERDLSDAVTFEGHVDERTKHEILASSWLLALPSLKEGWGLVIGEAAHHARPALAYRAAGGTTESIRDGVTGLLADDKADFVAKLRLLLQDEALRTGLGTRAHAEATAYTWDHATESFAHIIEAVLAGERVSSVDPD